MPRKHSHYFKSVEGLADVDVYRVLELFNVTDQALGHAIKKLLVAGGRGAGKDIRQGVGEAIDTLARWQEMRREDETRQSAAPVHVNLTGKDTSSFVKCGLCVSPDCQTLALCKRESDDMPYGERLVRIIDSRIHASDPHALGHTASA